VLALAGALVAAWLLVDPRTPDLAAQAYRVSLFDSTGFGVWDAYWYAGHHLPGYSLLFPALASALGMRAVGALCVVASVALFDRIVVPVYGAPARWGVAWFAVAAVGDVWIGRLTFALGVTFALASVLALTRDRPWLAAVLAGVCAASSPVAGVLLALAGVTHALADRSWRGASALVAPVVVVVGALALLFPEGGWEPYPTASLAATVAVTAGFLWTLPRQERTLRIGAVVYLAACLLCVVVRSPIGSNVERYAVLLAGPLLVCALGRRGRLSAGARRRRARGLAAAPRRGGLAASARPAVAATAAVLAGIAVWVVWGPVRETVAVAGNESTSASYYAPVKRFVAAHGGTLARVEVPLTRSHWEAAWLAPSVSLARGWEKQLDTRYDDVLLAPGLTAAAYRRWLHGEAVSYVALPDTPLDPSSAQEGALIRGGLAYLRPVLAGRHWRIYEVLDPTPLLEGPGRLTALGHESFALRAYAAGRLVVRIHHTRYWTVTGGAGCVGEAPGGWTAVTAAGPGVVSVAARFSLGRALGTAGACRAAAAEAPRR